jgi:hypothetical protein
MSAYALFTAGTLDERRSAWLAEFARRSGAAAPAGLPPFAVCGNFATVAGAAIPGAGTPAFWSLDDLARNVPSARCMVFLEPAFTGLSVALAAGLETGAREWLSNWCNNAAELLHRVQDDPSRFLLVDVSEARQHPAALTRVVATRFEIDLAPDLAAFPSVQIDPLCVVLAQSLAGADPRVRALQAELQASCTPLAPDQAWPDIDRVDPDFGDAAARCLAALQARATTQVDADAVTRAGSALSSARQENELLLQQVQQLHEELQFALLAPQQAVPEPDVSHMSPVDPDLLAARDTLLGVRAENEMLVQQVAQIQEELSHYYAKSRELEVSAALSVGGVSSLEVTIGDMIPAVERTSPPYRELTLTLRDLRVEGRHVPEAAVRLVEHHGHPGLVVLANPSGPQLFANWREAGREGDRAYTLLVPSDANTHPAFNAMDSIDWTVLQAVAVRIERMTRTAGTRTSLLWGHLARRFRQQLIEMPVRFRWASAAYSWLPNAGANTLSCRFDLVQCGSREVPNLALQWIVDGPRAGIELLCDTDAGPPLLSWPENMHGQIPDRLRMPFGPNSAAEEAERDYWSRLTQPDRDFVIDLLAVWPDVIAQVPQRLPGAALSSSELLSAAMSLKRQLRHEVPTIGRADSVRHPTSLARRVVRRVVRMTRARAA